jgi:hypothetical protein
MDWSDRIVARLAEQKAWAYHGDAPCASEPAALAALALLGHGRAEAALRPLDWLASLQSADGSIGVTATDTTPNWPASQAVLAWRQAQRQPGLADRYQAVVPKAVGWMLQDKGATIERSAEIAHDTMLVGWPWVAGTHSWMEPTCWCVLALRSAGQGENPRATEGVRLIVDRLLPEGGCNYGNTYILGQALRPHMQPTGICLLALAGETVFDPRIGRSIVWLEREIAMRTATASLSYALMGLSAQGCRPANADALLAAAARRTLDRDAGAYKLALLALAALADNNPLYADPAKKAAP